MLLARYSYSQSDTNIHKVDTLLPKADTLITQKDTIPKPDSIDSVVKYKSMKGIASFYSKNLEGTKTATGETFHHNKLTAASNNFKLNCYVRVTNLSNGNTTIVRINDRMHPRMAKKGRVVDLTRLGAQKLDFIKKGLTKVLVEEVPKGTKE